MSKYYPPPYFVCPVEDGDEAILIAAGSDVIASVELHPDPACEVNEYARGTAEFIVRACNDHDELVRALTKLTAWMYRIREEDEALVIDHSEDGFGLADCMATLDHVKKQGDATE